MMRDWQEITLGEITRLEYGKALKEDERNQNGDIPVFGSDGQVGWHDEYVCRTSGIIIGRKGNAGAINFSKSPFFCIDTTFYIQESEEYEIKYLYFVLKQSRIRSLTSDSAVPGLNRDAAYSLRIPLPPLPVQRQIAAILSAFDDKIELNRRINRTLEQMARALFKSWFVDFDPVRAKMRGEQPAAMETETAALFPDELVEVDGREVPKGWAWSPFDSNLVIFGGGTPKTSNAEFWGGEIPWYSVVDVPDEGDVWVAATEKTITEAGLNGSSTRLLPVGTSIISARGTVGKVALTAVPMAMNQSCYGLFPSDGESVNFVYFSTLAAVDDLKRRTHGAVFDTITRDTLQSIKSVQPTPDVLRAFENQCGQLTAKVLNNVHETICLARLRDSLLPRLLSGELDVTSWVDETEQVPA